MTYDFWKKAGVVTGVIGTLVIAGSVLANDGNVNVSNDAQNQNGAKRGMMQKGAFKASDAARPFMHTQEQREAIHAAALAGDYQAWLNLVSQDGELPEHMKNITADNFARFSEMHQNMQKAHEIREELGLKQFGKGRGKGMGVGRGAGCPMAQGLNNQ
jgi:hypothetical protein